QLQVARDALVSAFVHYRSDPWPSQVSMSHALALAEELTRAHPETVPLVFDALGEPFAVAAIEEPRRLVRLSVGAHRGTLYRGGEAIEPFERMFPGARTSCSTGLGATSRREIHVWSPPEPISRSTDAATVRTVLPDRRCLPPPRRHLRPSDTGICSSTALRELSSAGRRGQSLAPAAATGGQASSLLRDEQVHHPAVAAY